jgi:hypothetical protein
MFLATGGLLAKGCENAGSSNWEVIEPCYGALPKRRCDERGHVLRGRVRLHGAQQSSGSKAPRRAAPRRTAAQRL